MKCPVCSVEWLYDTSEEYDNAMSYLLSHLSNGHGIQVDRIETTNIEVDEE